MMKGEVVRWEIWRPDKRLYIKYWEELAQRTLHGWLRGLASGLLAWA